ncbi:MAG TPA: methionine synthase [Candidatus Copromorpha excrementigallinarum]|uniref:Methionine synthase n=1 Tax=Candidatus Allocopromorpha excrementigallinarum TaxID=2840742 RepID=A0A9D1I148_9FIRM|nr:methionine synthase [Candidatus Copromorpha excrementigallinarum]
MNIEVREKLSRDKWLAALGFKGKADKDLEERLSRCEADLLAAARPKGIYRIMKRDDVRTEGLSVKRHLEGCDQVAVMAVTLGIGVDNLIRKAQVTDMLTAVILDTGASVMIEQACDAFEDEIKKNTEKFTTSRFSPGYGDFPIEVQADMVRYVDGQRKIGLNVTGSSLMIPRKSVTAVIGLSEHPVKGRLASCNECVLRDKCILRKEGRFCGD